MALSSPHSAQLPTSTGSPSRAVNKEIKVPDVPPVFVTNEYFDDYTWDILHRAISWEGYRNAELITEQEYEVLSQYRNARTPSEYKVSDPDAFVSSLVKLLNKISRVEILLYLLAIIDELLNSNKATSDALVKRMRQSPDELLQPFFRCLKKGDDYLGLKACKIMIGLLVRAGDDVAKDFPYRKVFSYLTDTLKSEKTSVKDVAIQITRSILQLGHSRSILFDESSECLYELVGIFKRTHEEPGVFQSGIVAVPQLQYGAGLCLWLLTFDRHVAAKLNKRYDLVPTMVEIARSAVKEKVIRVIVATWRNLIELAPQSNMPFLVDSKTTDCLYSIKARKLKDEDIKADVDALIERTEEQRSHMSTWDFYVSEVRSGRLSWTPAHRDESFWAMHAAKLDDDNHCVIRALHELLKNPPDTLSIAVACHDIGQYVHFNPAGKQVVKQLGTKKYILAYMSHENPSVKYEALMAAQQLMKHAWEN